MTFDAALAELSAYTLTRGDAAFIHQHVVDAGTAQAATAETKPIAIAFALAGLYLHVEKGFTGRDVQLAHMKMARQRRTWPALSLPADRGATSAEHVLAAPAGPARDAAIHAWAREVWQAFSGSRETIAALLAELAIAPRA